MRWVGWGLGLAWSASIALATEEPFVHWVKSPRGTQVGTAHGLISDANGGVIAEDWESGLLHLDAQGGTITRNLPVGATVSVTDVDRTSHQYWTGGVYTNGTFEFPQVRGGFVAKVAPSGQFSWIRNNEVPEIREGDYSQWTYTYGHAKADHSGKVAFAGTSKGPFKLQSLEWDGEQGPFLCVLDASGNALWGHKVACQSISDPGTQESFGSPTPDPAGNIFVSGWLRAGTADFGGITVYPADHYPRGDFFVAKYTPEGRLLWVKLEYGESLAIGPQGEIYAVYTHFDSEPRKCGLARLGPDGDVLWEKPVNPESWNTQLAVDPLGQPVFAGSF